MKRGKKRAAVRDEGMWKSNKTSFQQRFRRFFLQPLTKNTVRVLETTSPKHPCNLCFSDACVGMEESGEPRKLVEVTEGELPGHMALEKEKAMQENGGAR